jgi:hypothetical protein
MEAILAQRFAPLNFSTILGFPNPVLSFLECILREYIREIIFPSIMKILVDLIVCNRNFGFNILLEFE